MPIRLCALLLLSWLAAGLHAADAKPLTIAVIPKGTTHEFWKTIHAGAVKAQRELTAAGQPVKIIWKGPLKEDDRTAQIDVVQNFLAQGVSGIVLAPLDSKALVAPVKDALEAGIPTVIIDSGLKYDQVTSFIATDNYAGGAKAAERMGEVLGGKGRVLVLRYMVGSASTELREAGFLDTIAKKFPDIKIVSSDQYAGATREQAQTAAQNLLAAMKDKIDAVFTSNESACAGMIMAIKSFNLDGKLKHIGFDASEPLIKALKAGAVQGLVVQDPFKMGYLGVMTVVAKLQGKAVEAKVDTPVQLVTPENIGTPEIQALISPQLGDYIDDAGK